jgi:hypothetical protein
MTLIGKTFKNTNINDRCHFILFSTFVFHGQLVHRIFMIIRDTTCCILTGLFISLKMPYENVSEKELIFADEGVTKRALHT